MADQFDPQERALIERLQNAPQSDLSEASFDTIRARLFDAVDNPPLPAPRPALRLTPVVVVAAVVALLLLTTVVLAALGVFNPPAAPTPTIAPSATLLPTALPALTATPMPTVTALPDASPVLTATSEPTQLAFIVIEGPVTEINGSTITIYNLHIIIDPADPLLPSIQIGDLLHIEGSADAAGNIIAITITPVNDEVNVNPENGETWQDDGNCDHPPPDWVPAHGWRRRCQGQSGNGNGNGRGNGKGNDDQGEDDDD